jgi:hypothetical protein
MITNVDIVPSSGAVPSSLVHCSVCERPDARTQFIQRSWPMLLPCCRENGGHSRHAAAPLMLTHVPQTQVRRKRVSLFFLGSSCEVNAFRTHWVTVKGGGAQTGPSQRERIEVKASCVRYSHAGTHSCQPSPLGHHYKCKKSNASAKRFFLPVALTTLTSHPLLK